MSAVDLELVVWLLPSSLQSSLIPVVAAVAAAVVDSAVVDAAVVGAAVVDAAVVDAAVVDAAEFPVASSADVLVVAAVADYGHCNIASALDKAHSYIRVDSLLPH